MEHLEYWTTCPYLEWYKARKTIKHSDNLWIRQRRHELEYANAKEVVVLPRETEHGLYPECYAVIHRGEKELTVSPAMLPGTYRQLPLETMSWESFKGLAADKHPIVGRL